MIDREKVIKALECRKNADKRCGNPCEDTGLCHYATAVRGLDGEIYRPFICDRERICADVLTLLKEQEAKTVIKIAKRFYDCDLTGFCPFCSRPLIKNWAENYCGYCGKPVLWKGR